MTTIATVRPALAGVQGSSAGGGAGRDERGAMLERRLAVRIERAVGHDKFRRYFEGAARFRLVGHGVEVAVPTAFHAQWLGRHFGDCVAEAVRAEAGAAEVRWLADPAAFDAAEVNAHAVERASAAETAVGAAGATPADRAAGATPPAPAAGRPAGRLRSGERQAREHRRSLEEFIVGRSNRLAFNAALALAESRAEAGFRVLFLHGDCGVGKTHLLQGVADRYERTHPGGKVRCITGERFANEYIASVHAGTIDSFRRRYRGLDLLCIDDVHFLGGKEKTQSEFLHTFNALELGGARVVIASDGGPRQIASLSQQLVSRFMSGMVVQIDRPERALREAIAREIARRRGLDLDPSAVEIVVNESHGSVRELEGALARVEALVRLVPGVTPADARGVITGGVVRTALGEAGQPRLRRPVRVGTVIEAAAEAFGVTPSDVLGTGRHKRVVLARAVAAYLARTMTSHSFPEIARALGRVHHSTIVTAFQRLARQIEAGEVCDAGPEFDGVALADLCDRVKAEVLRRSETAA
ncbi:MAG: AAA family ATPase [Phycisphaerales bacterium]|nr:AAA family ATPase [Phycisphaerales bacterium]